MFRSYVADSARRGLASLALAVLALPLLAQGTVTDAVLVPEMEEPPGVVVQDKATRASLEREPGAQVALERFRAELRATWPQLRQTDWLALSRYQRQVTEGWEAPDLPGELPGRVLGRDDAGRWHLELRGPRLPARYDITFRYAYFFATYDPSTERIADWIVTVRGWVEE